MRLILSKTFILVMGAAAIVVPMAASIYFASRQSLDIEMDSALFMADEIIRRSDEITRQASIAIDRLKSISGGHPCSEANTAAMREMAMAASYVSLIGYVAHGRLVCSSLGRKLAPLALGPVDIVNNIGVAIRTRAGLPIAPNVEFIIVEKDSYAAAINRDIPLDIFLNKRDVALGIISSSTGRVILNRGPFDPAWLRAIPKGAGVKFFDGKNVVGIRRSAQFDIAAIAAVPAKYLDLTSRQLSQQLLPFGLLAGLGLGFAVNFLFKQQTSLPAILKASLKNGEFYLLYQPVMDLGTGKCIGAEALVRWCRRDGDVVLPDVFIPVAEDSEQIQQLTAAVFGLIEREVPALTAEFPDVLVGVNLAPIDLHSEQLIIMISGLLERTGIKPHNLMMEATERGFIDTDRSNDTIGAMRRMGIRLATDDFGTGYSSLSYLTSLQVDCLKIDKSFVDTIGVHAATSRVVFYIIEMAKALKLKMVAEGVENPEQADFLRKHGVECAQGWLYAKPMPMAELREFLKANGAATRSADFAAAPAGAELRRRES